MNETKSTLVIYYLPHVPPPFGPSDLKEPVQIIPEEAFMSVRGTAEKVVFDVSMWGDSEPSAYGIFFVKPAQLAEFSDLIWRAIINLSQSLRCDFVDFLESEKRYFDFINKVSNQKI